MKIIVELELDSYDPAHRWRAYDDNTYDYGGDDQRSPLGYGPTDIEAVRELMTQIEEKRDAES